MNPNFTSLLLLLAVTGNRDRDDRLIQFLLIASLLGGATSLTGATMPTTTTGTTSTALCPPVTQCDLSLLVLALGAGGGGLFGGGGGLFGRREDRDRDRDKPPTGGGAH